MRPRSPLGWLVFHGSPNWVLATILARIRKLGSPVYSRSSLGHLGIMRRYRGTPLNPRPTWSLPAQKGPTTSRGCLRIRIPRALEVGSASVAITYRAESPVCLSRGPPPQGNGFADRAEAVVPAQAIGLGRDYAGGHCPPFASLLFLVALFLSQICVPGLFCKFSQTFNFVLSSAILKSGFFHASR